MPRLIYQYMIVFAHSRGNGRMELFRTKKIKEYEDLKSIDKYVTDRNGFSCCVIDYKLMNVRLRASNFFDTLKDNSQNELIK